MLEYKLQEDGREVAVRSYEEDLTWPEVVQQIVVFLHACGYVFEEGDVEETAASLKQEIQEAEHERS